MNLAIRLDDYTIHDLSRFDAVQVRGVPGKKIALCGVRTARVTFDLPEDPEGEGVLPDGAAYAAILDYLPTDQCGAEVVEAIAKAIMLDDRIADLRGMIAEAEEQAKKAKETASES